MAKINGNRLKCMHSQHKRQSVSESLHCEIFINDNRLESMNGQNKGNRLWKVCTVNVIRLG